MFQIKICGITNIEDGAAAARAGAEAIGLNFYLKSSRYVEPHIASSISTALPAGVARVGVFVNQSANEIAAILQQVDLDWVQLHGDEPPELIADLPATVLILRAHRCDSEGLAPLVKFLEESRRHGRVPDAVLVDAYTPSEYGGTGLIADWQQIADSRAALGDVPLILAGGLTPVNVAEAIQVVRPAGVDTASGVECDPGQKDPQLVADFVTEARQAFGAIY